MSGEAIVVVIVAIVGIFAVFLLVASIRYKPKSGTTDKHDTESYHVISVLKNILLKWGVTWLTLVISVICLFLLFGIIGRLNQIEIRLNDMEWELSGKKGELSDLEYELDDISYELSEIEYRLP
ncbi:hypothetical protein ACFLXO_01290 [Chloroflexota bacterium]